MLGILHNARLKCGLLASERGNRKGGLGFCLSRDQEIGSIHKFLWTSVNYGTKVYACQMMNGKYVLLILISTVSLSPEVLHKSTILTTFSSLSSPPPPHQLVSPKSIVYASMYIVVNIYHKASGMSPSVINCCMRSQLVPVFPMCVCPS